MDKSDIDRIKRYGPQDIDEFYLFLNFWGKKLPTDDDWCENRNAYTDIYHAFSRIHTPREEYIYEAVLCYQKWLKDYEPKPG